MKRGFLEAFNNMRTKVSIVVLNWNGKDHLQKCLTSLRRISYSPAEVIVVDNASTDGSQQLVKNKFPWVNLLGNKQNLGYAGGNNRGIRESKSEFFFILNNDTEVTKDFLEPLVHLMETDTRVACVQPKILYGHPRDLLNAVGSYFTSTGILYHYGYRKKQALSQYNKRLRIYSAKGAAMLLRRKALDKVGLFDEDFFIFFEETDLCHRLWLAGYTVMYEPSSIIYHYEAVDTTKQMQEFTRTYLSFRNRICSYLKNLEAINIMRVFLVLFPFYGLLAVFYIITLKPDLALALVKGVFWNIGHFRDTMKKRSVVQKLRTFTDEELFSIIKHDPPPVYYYYLFTSLKNFRYEKPI